MCLEILSLSSPLVTPLRRARWKGLKTTADTPLICKFGSVRRIVGGSQSHDRDPTNGRHRQESNVLEAAPPEDGTPTLLMSVGYISSPNNAFVKHLVRLRQSPKARNSSAAVLVVGTIPLREVSESLKDDERRLVIDVLLMREDVETPEDLAGLAVRIVKVSVAVMIKVSGLDSPPEAIGVLPFPSTFTALEQFRDPASLNVRMQEWCSSPRRILVLDAIQDPGNLGTLLRTAAAFAWDGVFLLHGCCDPFNEKALRAARGASFRMSIATGQWSHVREFASNNKLGLYAGDPEPDRPFQMPGGPLHGFCPICTEDKPIRSEDNGRFCLVLGSEGQGLSAEVNRDCSPIGIPMPGKFESLNVAVAGGILMFLLR